jgi:hypothetical protein
MTDTRNDLDQALNDVSASSAGGAPFLIAYGATFILTGILSFFIPVRTAALIAMFQGAVALPVAFWLERKMGSKRMQPDNPLKALSGLMAMSQALGLPALIIAYSLNPIIIPAMLAGLGGVHFVPYAWLHRTRVYIILGAALSIGAFILLSAAVLREWVVPITLLYVGLVYWIAAPLVYRNAAELVRAEAV